MTVLPEVKQDYGRMCNYINGQWVESDSARELDVMNPSTGESIGTVPLSTKKEVDEAVEAAHNAFWQWRTTPPINRARVLMALRELLEKNREELARIVVQEHGKTIDDARGEVQRAIEAVEVATGIPSLMMGYNLEDVSAGIDEYCMRQPLGVFAAIAPFNFPLMVPFWFLPFAIGCGNTFVLKPSEQVPISMQRVMSLVEAAGFPPGVVNLVNGDKEAVDGLLDNPKVVGVSFVGSSPVARYIYRRASEQGKRVQCQGGAKNFIVVMPDADLDQTVPNLLSSFFGSAGERCLAGSVLLAVGDVYEPLKEKFAAAAAKMKIGYGLDESVGIGPVISKSHRDRILGYIDKGIAEGAKLILDGRQVKVANYPEGYYVGPTIFDKATPQMTIAREEIFGPVGAIIPVEDLEEAMGIIDDCPFGNAASIFTGSGKAARTFQYTVRCGNIGINIGVAAPMAFFPFSGMKDSFFGDLHAQGRDAFNFFTERKVVITRWF